MLFFPPYWLISLYGCVGLARIISPSCHHAIPHPSPRSSTLATPVPTPALTPNDKQLGLTAAAAHPEQPQTLHRTATHKIQWIPSDPTFLPPIPYHPLSRKPPPVPAAALRNSAADSVLFRNENVMMHHFGPKVTPNVDPRQQAGTPLTLTLQSPDNSLFFTSTWSNIQPLCYKNKNTINSISTASFTRVLTSQF